MNDGWGISYEISLRWMPLDLTDDKSTLVQVMAWCRQATSHYLSQCWPRSVSPYGVVRPQWVLILLTPEHPKVSYSLYLVWGLVFETEKVWGSKKLFGCSDTYMYKVHRRLVFSYKMAQFYTILPRVHVLLLDCFTLLLARHLADVSCYIGPSMPSGICMEIHTEIVQKRKKKPSHNKGTPRQPQVYL